MRSSLLFFSMLYLPLTGAEPDTTLLLSFHVTYQGEELKVDQEPITEIGESITDFRCYLSCFELHSDGKSVWKEPDSFHLLDASDSSSLQVKLSIPSALRFDRLTYRIGVDSLTSCSGAFGGDLDPTNGMYWTWQSGYIHFKFEGKHPDSPTYDNGFQYHLGGYLAPHAVFPVVAHNVDGPSSILIDLDALLRRVPIRDNPQIMSPGAEAFGISELLPAVFKVSDED